jgi:hypothetical protein
MSGGHLSFLNTNLALARLMASHALHTIPSALQSITPEHAS